MYLIEYENNNWVYTLSELKYYYPTIAENIIEKSAYYDSFDLSCGKITITVTLIPEQRYSL